MRHCVFHAFEIKSRRAFGIKLPLEWRKCQIADLESGQRIEGDRFQSPSDQDEWIGSRHDWRMIKKSITRN
jgi:hypothetical protein